MRFFKRHIESVQQTDCATKVVSSLKQEEKLVIDLARPTVFYLPGNETTDGRHTDYLDTNSRILETHLARAATQHLDKIPEIFTISYSENKPHTINKEEHGYLTMALKVHDKARAVFTRVPQVLAYKKSPDRYISQDAKDFVAEIILPALKDGDVWADTQTLSQKLKNLTFVGNSYGSIFATEVGRELKNQLKASHVYDDNTIHDALKQVVHIAAPNVSNILSIKDDFTGIYFEGRSDVYRDFVQDKAHPHTACRFPLLNVKRNSHKTSSGLHLKEPKERVEINPINAGVQVLFTPAKQMHLVDPDFNFVIKQEEKSRHHSFIHDDQGHAFALYTVPPYTHGGALSQRNIGTLFGQTLRNAALRADAQPEFSQAPEAMVNTPSHRGARQVIIGDKVDSELLATTEPAIRPTTKVSQGETQGNTAHITSTPSVAV